MLKGNIRFVSKELVFDIAIVRTAEVIWIQTNAIPHKAYNRIVDAARKQGKPIRYFQYTDHNLGNRKMLLNNHKACILGSR